MLLLALLCLTLGLFILGLYHFGGSAGVLLLVVFVAAVQFLQNLFASTVFVQIGGDLVVSPGSALLFPATFMVLLLVAIRNGVAETRQLIYALLASNLLLALLVGSGRLAQDAGYLSGHSGPAAWLHSFSIPTYLVGTGLLILDAVLLLVLHQTLRRAGLPAPVRVIGSLVAVLAFDSVAFVLLAPGLPRTLLPGQLVGKSTAGLTYGALLSGYLYAAGRSASGTQAPAQRRYEWLDLFSILRYRERYRSLERQSRQVERRAAEQVGLLLDNTEEAIIGLDESGKCTLSNASAGRMLGYASREELRGKAFHDLAHPVGTAESRLPVEQCPICSVSLTGEARSGDDLELRRSDGTTFPVEYWAHPIRRSEGTYGAVLTFLDISRRKRSETELRTLEQRYRELFRDAPEMYVLTRSAEGGPEIAECSDSFFATLGYAREEVLGRRLADFYSEQSRRELIELGGYEQALRGHFSDAERDLVSRSGEIVQTTLRARPERNPAGEVIGTRAIYVNITERKRVETLLRLSRERLRRLADSLQVAREEERKSLARTMHDELGQALTALHFDLAWLEERVDRPALIERVASMIEIVDQLIDTVRDLSARLRPHVLDTLGLAAAVEWEVEQFRQRTGLRCSLEISSIDRTVDRALGPDGATALFRILQEALTNIARHAEAEEAWVHLRRSDSQVVLEVEDDGLGIRDEEITSVHSSGLIGVRERVGARGGRVEIGRRSDAGTRLAVRMPL